MRTCKPPFRRRWTAWAWLPLLLTALVRAAWLIWVPVDPLGSVDAEGFHLLSVNMLDGNGFAIGWEAPFCPTAIRTPLYPLFLAGVYGVFGRNKRAAVLVQLLLEVVTAAGVMALTRMVAVPNSTGSAGPFRRGGRAEAFRASVSSEIDGARQARRGLWFLPLLAGTAYALNGTTQRYTGFLLSENLLLPLIVLALVQTTALLRRPTSRRALFSAVLWALALLTKPNVFFLVIAVGILLFGRLALEVRRSRPLRLWHNLRVGLVFAGVLFLCLAPWILRNHLSVGRWLLSTAFEENIARVSAVATLAELLGVEAEPWSETWEHLYGLMATAWSPDIRPHALLPSGTTCEALARRQADIAKAAHMFVLDHLGVAVKVHFRGVTRSLLDPGHRLWYHRLVGRDWATTGVVADIWRRMTWSLDRGAVGDALLAFWRERVVNIPPGPAVVWWGLMVGRVVLWWLGLRGMWRLRSRACAALLLGGTVLYHLVLPGPIAHDRFYVSAIPAVSSLVACGAERYNTCHRRPPREMGGLGGHHD
ncbi:MAG: hypothetical protein ACP5HS_02780 [Anaerolineae bacterium]